MCGRKNLNFIVKISLEFELKKTCSVPHTTRPARHGEVHGQEYYFIPYAEMNSAISRGEFLEYGEHENQIYGTRLGTIKEIVQSGTVAILDVEPNALRILRTKAYAPLVVYVAPGNADRSMGYEVRKMNTHSTELNLHVEQKIDFRQKKSFLSSFLIFDKTFSVLTNKN